jgi:hypothetical protein
MANTTLTADVVAKAALVVLDNELGVVNSFYRAHESEFSETVNGYKKGQTISIRRPADFTVRSGSTMDLQDVIEGKTTLTVDQQIGVDFEFSSTDMTLNMNDLSERVIKPAMTNIVNHMASDCLGQFYQGVYNWAGTAGQTINSFSDFLKGPERLSEMAVPMDQRCAVLSPADYYAMVGAQAGLGSSDKLVNSAWANGELSNIAGMQSVYMSQVTPTHTNGAAVDTNAVTDGNSQEVSYDTAKNTWTQTLVTDGWGTSQSLPVGSVFTIAGVYMVNPKTKESTGILQQFVVTTTVTTNANASNDTNITISPPIIVSGPHQTVTYSGNFDGLEINLVGAASTAYKQNLVYHKNAFSVAVVPMEMPQGSVNGSRRSYKGLSVRVIPVYDGINDVSKWRLDLLYGRKLIDPRLATRLSGTA